MKSRLSFLLLAALVAPPTRAQIGSNPAGAPAENWEMKIFTKEGFRSMILRGTEVRMTAANRYDVLDLSITIFSGEADARVDNILLSPAATFFAKENRASGEKAVRLIRDDMEITGEQWTYVHAQRKVTIQKNSRVVFHAALPDLIQ
jgi:hypothetical protein